MKNARKFFLQVSKYKGIFCFLTTCIASCNSAVTECEQMYTVCYLRMSRWDIVMVTLYSPCSPETKSHPIPPHSYAQYLHMLITDQTISNIHHAGQGCCAQSSIVDFVTPSQNDGWGSTPYISTFIRAFILYFYWSTVWRKDTTDSDLSRIFSAINV